VAPKLAGLVAALAALIPSPVPAAAAGDVTARFTAFVPWTAADRPLSFSLVVRNERPTPVDDAGVKLTIYERVLSRSALRSALDGRPLGDELAVTTEALAETLAPGEERAVSVQRDLASLANVFRPGRRGLGGVYPVKIQMRGAGRTLATGYSAIVFFSGPPAPRLNVAWIVPVHRPPMFDGEAYNGAVVDRELSSGGPLAHMASLLSTHAGAPLTIAPSGVLLEELADLADGYSRREHGEVRAVGPDDPTARAAAGALSALKTAAAPGTAEVAGAAYAFADLVALVHADLAGDAGRQVALGRARVAALLGREPNPTLFVPAGLRLDARSAESAAGLGIRRLVLDPDALPPQESLFGPDRPVRATGSGDVHLDALLADAPIRERLESMAEDADPVLVAQGVLAETASSWFERPALSGGRGIVIGTGAMPDPRVAEPLLAGLAGAPWVRLRTASDLLAAVPPLDEPQPLVTGSAGPGTVLSAVRAARRAVQTLVRVVVTPDGPSEQLDRLLLAAESADWTGKPAGGIALARAARAQAEALLAKIRAPGRRVTLTSRAGQLPVTLLNDTGLTVRVRVRLSSAKVEFPEGPSRVIELSQRATTLTFPAVARATGAFGVAVEIRTPDGDVVIGSGQVIVRSTAVSAVALAATGGAGVFLVVAWLRRSGKRRAAPPGAAAA
jgi:hypothetical protein